MTAEPVVGVRSQVPGPQGHLRIGGDGDAVDGEGPGGPGPGDGDMGPLVQGQGLRRVQPLLPLLSGRGDGEPGHRMVVGRPDGEVHVGEGRLGILGVRAPEAEDRRVVGELDGVPARVGDGLPVVDRGFDPGGDGEVAQAGDDPIGQPDVLRKADGGAREPQGPSVAPFHPWSREPGGGGQRLLALGQRCHHVVQLPLVDLVSRAGVGLGQHAHEVPGVVPPEVPCRVLPALQPAPRPLVSSPALALKMLRSRSGPA